MRQEGLAWLLWPILIVPTLVAQPEIAVHRAVEISWQSLPNKLYQVMGSDSVAGGVWVEAGGPVLGTGATVRKVLLSDDASHGFYRLNELSGTVTNWLQGLSDLDFRPATLAAQEGGLLAEGVRATAVGITPDDLLTTRFQFDLDSQSLRLVHYQVARNIGVFNERFFAKDVTAPPAVTTGATAIPDYTWHALSGSSLVVNLALEAGHVLNYGLRLQSREYAVDVLDPDGGLMFHFNGPANAQATANAFPILRGGSYQIRIRPLSAPAGTSMSCQFFYANNNRTALRQVGHGERLTAALRQSTQDYAKYRILLARSQVLRLPAPPSAAIRFRMVDARSQKLVDIRGPLIFDAPADGPYYLFIYKAEAEAGDLSYSGAISIGS